MLLAVVVVAPVVVVMMIVNMLMVMVMMIMTMIVLTLVIIMKMKHNDEDTKAVCLQASSDDIAKAIKELLHNPRYQDSITTASNLFREQYGVPLQTAAYWLDHVMRYGGGYMRSSGQEMPLYQFLMVDVMLVLAGCSSVLLVIVYLCVRLYGRFCSSARMRGKTDKTE